DDRAALIAGLKDGVITCIATDHAPHAHHEKDVPFEAAPFGVTGLETSFSALYTHLVDPGLVSLEMILERLSTGPARAYGLDEPRIAVGEAVFTTAMTGYQEVITDPSFAEQIVCFTAPMVGNYGVAEGRNESSRPHARAVVMREARGPGWTDWLHERGIVALSGIDTR